MRSTRQGSTRAESEEMAMQQVMGMMQGLQEAMAASKAEQERMQEDLAASQARNEELCHMNEELRRGGATTQDYAMGMSPRVPLHQGSSLRHSRS